MHKKEQPDESLKRIRAAIDLYRQIDELTKTYQLRKLVTDHREV